MTEHCHGIVVVNFDDSAFGTRDSHIVERLEDECVEDALELADISGPRVIHKEFTRSLFEADAQAVGIWRQSGCKIDLNEILSAASAYVFIDCRCHVFTFGDFFSQSADKLGEIIAAFL